jgi:DsbC/DsbD-like thiol-disulfide interchange protein
MLRFSKYLICKFRLIGLALFASGLAMGPAHAGSVPDASSWVADQYAAARLIAGSSPAANKTLRAGIEIKMPSGWHTYWRYPGDSGVPPTFDFTGSKNLASVKVLYPAPHLMTDETGQTLGYTDDVVLPLRVTPRDAGKPVALRLKLDYAVCEKVCVPEEGHLALDLTSAASTHDERLAAAEARVPKRVAPDALGLSVHRLHSSAKPKVLVDLKLPNNVPAQVFAEGPTPEWALPVPKPTPSTSTGYQRFTFALDGLPPGTDPKSPVDLTLTVTAGPKAYEVRTRLD